MDSLTSFLAQLRTDLANTAMHITGLQLPGLSVEDVLSATIQPPEQARIRAAMFSLTMVGAIDANERLTSLGHVLLQLPVEAAIGKLCLLGSFFRCLEPTLTLAAILTNRDPFLSPPLMKEEAARIKNLWPPTDFRSDPFATLEAYNVWWKMQGRGDYSVRRSHFFSLLASDFQTLRRVPTSLPTKTSSVSRHSSRFRRSRIISSSRSTKPACFRSALEEHKSTDVVLSVAAEPLSFPIA